MKEKEQRDLEMNNLSGSYDPSNDKQFYYALKWVIENEDWQKFFLSYPGTFVWDLPDDTVPITKRGLKLLINKISELEEDLK